MDGKGHMTAGHKMDENTKETSQQKRDKEKEKSGAASKEGRAGSTGWHPGIC